MLGLISNFVSVYLQLGLGLALFNLASGYKIHPQQANNGWLSKYIQTDEDNMVATIAYNLLYVTLRYAWIVLGAIPNSSTVPEEDTNEIIRSTEEQAL